MCKPSMRLERRLLPVRPTAPIRAPLRRRACKSPCAETGGRSRVRPFDRAAGRRVASYIRARCIREGSVMDITEVRVFPVNEERLKAYVTITLDACFVVRDLKVINGNTGLFVAMPAKRRKDGTFKDIAHPLNSETRERMEKIILAEYEREVTRGAPPSDAAAAS